VKFKLRLLLWLLPALFSLHCAQKPVLKDQQSCYRWAAEGNVSQLEAQWNLCQKANTEHATTLLMTAAAHGQLEIMSFLEKHGSDLNERDLTGDTALHYAVSTDQPKSVMWLLENGALQKSFRQDGISPLMIALNRCRGETVDLLLSKPVDINAKMEDGWTALFYAVRREDPEILKKILDLGADMSIKSVDKETALDLAKEQGWPEAIKLLQTFSKSHPLNGNKRKSVNSR
jgi:ankyrin repeat protein